jgi:haloalkane dehalogenase
LSELQSAAGLAYREALPDGHEAPSALLVHGYPESSYMWRELLPVLAGAGLRAVAPDLAGFGDSPPDPPGTWERHVESLERLHTALELGPTVLIVHDWGSLIGLRWACDHPEAIAALVISGGGFFADGRWHALAASLRTPGEGEQLIESFTREGFVSLMRGAARGIDDAAIAEYWKCFADPVRRRGQLELYRSGDFEKLRPYEGKLAALGVPTLLLWGADDPFAPLSGAYRFHKQIPGSQLAAIEGVGHFVWEDAPERAAAEVAAFLSRSR